MVGWRPRGTTVLVMAAAVSLMACSGQKPGKPRKDARAIEEQLDHGAGEALKRDIEQQVVPQAVGESNRKEAQELQPGDPIWVQSGKTRLLQLPSPVKRVSIGNPDLAGIVVLGPRTIMLNAKALPAGRGQRSTSTGRAGLVTGRTLTPEPRFGETTFTIWDSSGAPDVHTLFVADFIDLQVMLEVTVADINRTAAEQHGIDFRAVRDSFISAYFMGGGAGPNPLGGGAGQSVTVPPGGQNALLPIGTTSTAPVYAFVLPKQDITGFIQALQIEGLATVLAQPKLVALSGQNAVFQVGGEIPIRIATGFSTDVEFKPFGTIVNFIARVAEEGDIILTVTPEVSAPDFNALVEGIPTFRTRRASTAVRMRAGHTLVIGGLMQTSRREEVRGIPYLKDIPVVGYIFRSSSYIDEVTELVVVVTPQIVRPMPPGTELVMPTDRGPLTNEEIRTRPTPSDAARPRLPGLP